MVYIYTLGKGTDTVYNIGSQVGNYIQEQNTQQQKETPNTEIILIFLRFDLSTLRFG